MTSPGIHCPSSQKAVLDGVEEQAQGWGHTRGEKSPNKSAWPSPSANWLIGSLDSHSQKPEIVISGFKRAGIFDALSSGQSKLLLYYNWCIFIHYLYCVTNV